MTRPPPSMRAELQTPRSPQRVGITDALVCFLGGPSQIVGLLEPRRFVAERRGRVDEQWKRCAHKHLQDNRAPTIGAEGSRRR